MASVCPEPVPVRAAHMRSALSDAHGIPSSSIITIPSHFSEEAFFSNDETFNPLSATVPGLCNLTPPARMATRAEQRMTFSQAFRLYPKAIIWSILLSLIIVMDGYDMSLLTSLFTLPVFQRSYGSAADDEESGFRISPVWEAALINGIQAGVVIGLIANGVIADRFGYRRTSISALLVLGALVFLAVFARSLQTLLAAQILCGIPWGMFEILFVAYAAEVMPVVLRGYFLSYINLCGILGQICGVGVIRALVDIDSKWAYRLPFTLQWAFLVATLSGVVFAPESPWWLIRQDRPDDARNSLLRLMSKGAGALGVEEMIAVMKYTNEVKKHYGNSKMTYLNCFQGVNRRRTEIATMVWVTQLLCGSALTFYALPFYVQAGFQLHDSFNLGIGMYGASICANVACWFLLPWVGRRRLFLSGAALSLPLLITCGCVSQTPATAAQSWTLGSLIIVKYGTPVYGT